MPNKTVFMIKKELSAHGIPFNENANLFELRKLFGGLPISSGQIRELKLLGIDYKQDWNWTRKTASEFIKDSEDYLRLRSLLPASPKQRILLLQNGITISKGITNAEASRMINNLPPTAAQIAYFEKNNLRLPQGHKLTFGYAQQIIARRERRIMEFKLNRNIQKK